ncbi:MAG: ABC transporter substrate-binding protein, partial [Clostridium paraputrificum]
MKLKKLGLLTAVGVLGLSLVSCGSKTDGNTGASKENKETSVVEEQTEVVVGTSVAVVQILDKLGVKVSGVPTSSYDLPESTKDATKVGNPMSPDMEIIKSLSPDVVISTDTLGDDYEELFKSNNIPSLFVNLDSVDGLRETIKTFAEK